MGSIMHERKDSTVSHSYYQFKLVQIILLHTVYVLNKLLLIFTIFSIALIFTLMIFVRIDVLLLDEKLLFIIKNFSIFKMRTFYYIAIDVEKYYRIE